MPDTPSLGEILHRARQASTDGRDRPWPVEEWGDRHPRLQAIDEAMAAAVAAAVRERIAAEIERLAYADQPPSVPGLARDTQRDTYLAARQVVLHGVGGKRSDEEDG